MCIRPIALCFGLVVTPGLAHPAHAQYDVTTLQDAGGQGHSQPSAVNASGQSVGYSYTSRGEEAVLWSPSGKATVLQDFGGQGGNYACSINDAGQSVGESGYSDGAVAALWSVSGKATELHGGGLGANAAVAINDAGQSVGFSLGPVRNQPL